MSLTAKKSLGQHFLSDEQVIHDIIAVSEIKKDEKVLEIGPGTGVLTKALLQAGATVIAFEKDDRAIEVLKSTFKKELENGSFVLLHQDYLKTTPESLNNLGLFEGQFKIVANIPYYITGKILSHALENITQPQCMILMVQKEVADRIVAKDGKESILSLSVKLFGTPELVRYVSRLSFRPPPDVESAVIAIKAINNDFFAKFEEISAKDSGTDQKIECGQKQKTGQNVFQFIKAGFAHKRKILIKNLEEMVPKEAITTVWEKLNLAKNTRAEELGVEEWKNLITELYQQ